MVRQLCIFGSSVGVKSGGSSGGIQKHLRHIEFSFLTQIQVWGQ